MVSNYTWGKDPIMFVLAKNEITAQSNTRYTIAFISIWYGAVKVPAICLINSGETTGIEPISLSISSVSTSYYKKCIFIFESEYGS